MGNQTKSDDEKKNTATKTKKRGLKTAISHLTCASQEFHTQF
jgi:hypothetical protein